MIPTITHNIYDTQNGFYHSLTVDGKESPLVGYTCIARNGIYGAITACYGDSLPTVFRLDKLNAEYKTAIYTEIPAGKKTIKLIGK